MTFQDALNTAPADADFIGFKNPKDSYAVLTHDGDTCAIVSQLGYNLFIAGVSANGKSFWDADARQFLTGTVEQLSRAGILAN